MSDFQIQLVGVNAPDELKVGGRSILDVSDFQVRRYRKLLDIDNVQSEQILGGFLNTTKINDFYLGTVAKHNTKRPIEFSIIVIDGSDILPFDTLQVLQVVEKGYEIRMVSKTATWDSLAAKTTIKEVLTGVTYLHSKENIISSWDNPLLEGGVLLAPVHFNSWYYLDLFNLGEPNKGVVSEDIRPMFRLKWLVELCMSFIGWNIDCPYLNSPLGLNSFAYILSKKIGSQETDLDQIRFKAATDSFMTVNVVFNAPTGQFRIEPSAPEISDNGNFYNPANGLFSGVGEQILKFKGTVKYSVPPQGQTLAFIGASIIRYGDFVVGSPQNIFNAPNNDQVLGGDFTLEFDFEWRTTILPGETASVFFGLHATQMTYEFYNEPIHVPFLKGQTYDLGESIDENYTVLQLMQGLRHKINGLTDDNDVSKTLVLYPSQGADVFGSTVPSFYTNEINDISERVISPTKKVNISHDEIERYERLGFANSTDASIRQKENDNLNLKQEVVDLHSWLVDYGSDKKVGTKQNQNPFFEPTLNSKDQFVSGSRSGLDIALMHDNTSGNISKNIGPRILFYRKLTQYGDNEVKHWTFEGTIQTDFPYLFQVPNNQEETFTPAGVIDIPERLIYGNDNEVGFYFWFWSAWLFSKLNDLKDAYELITINSMFKKDSFRQLYKCFYKTDTNLYRLIQIDDFDKRRENAQYVLFPETNNVAIPSIEDTGGGGICSNAPRINIIDNGATISATADNSGINSAIDTDAWSYSIDGVTWTLYIQGDPLPSNVTTIFRRIVNYSDGCPMTIVSKQFTYVSPCRNSGTIVITYDAPTSSASAVGDDVFNSVVQSDSWTATVDGGTPQNYVAGTSVPFVTNVVFDRVVTFVDGCPDLILTNAYIKGTSECENFPLIESRIVSDCIYDLYINATNCTSEIFTTYFYIAEDGVNFLPWDKRQIQCKPGLIIRAMVSYKGTCANSKIEITLT